MSFFSTKKSIVLFGLASLIFALLSTEITSPVFAQAPPMVVVTRRIAAGSIEQIMANIIEWALSVAGYFLLLAIIIGSILYISSTGEENRITAAKKTITWAIMGAILILVAYTISSLVYKFFGL